MEIEGYPLKAALACAARPSKKRPHFWATMSRIAPRDAKTSVLEATNGVVLMRLVLQHPQECEAYLPHEVLSRVKSADVVVIEGRELRIEESGLTVELRDVPAPSLPAADGKNLRLWPDFDGVIPKGKRSAANLVCLSAGVMGCVMRAARLLGTTKDPVILRMEAGGPSDPVKLSGRCSYGELVFAVMPVSLIPEEPKKPKDGAPDGKTAAAGKDAP
jgi:hypothetical protein